MGERAADDRVGRLVVRVVAGVALVLVTVACAATVEPTAESITEPTVKPAGARRADRGSGTAAAVAEGGGEATAERTAERSAGGDGHRINALTYNVCAAGNRDRTCARDLTWARRKVWASRVAGLIRSRNVDVASFTEMCYAQVNLLKRELPDYRMVWYGIAPGGGDRCRLLWGDLTSKTTPPDGKCFGMALALKGRVDGLPLRRMLKADHAPADADAKIHPRGLLCARTTIGPRRSVCCVTHISDTETPEQVTRLVARYAGRTPVILTGDFNRQPGDGQLTPVYGLGLGTGEYTEVDAVSQGTAGTVPDGRAGAVRGGTPTTRGGRKIDYIFATEGDYRALGAEVIKTRPELSDHRALAGTLIMTAPRPMTPPHLRTAEQPTNGGAPSPGIAQASRRRMHGRHR